MGDDVEREVVAHDEGKVSESGNGEGGVGFLQGRRDSFDDDEVRGVVRGGMGDGGVAGRVGVLDGERGRDALEGEEGGGGGVDADVDRYGRVGSNVEDARLIESGGRPGRGSTGVGGEGEAESRRELASREAVAPSPDVDSTEDARISLVDDGLDGSESGADEEDGLWR
jgi:hypothetical protein